MSKLKCRYINYHSFLYIAPVKEEIVFDNPTIWLYHDVITDKQVDTFKKHAYPKVILKFVQNLFRRFNKLFYLVKESNR